MNPGSLHPDPVQSRVLVLDNRDSFVFNLVEEFRCLACEVRTVRSGLTLDQLNAHLVSFAPDLVVLSPGPGRPEDAGVMVEWLTTDPEVPILGICLGHQAMAVANGGTVDRAPRAVHGRSSLVRIIDEKLLSVVPSPMVVARYHSLVVTQVPSNMRTVALTEEGTEELVMGMRHRTRCQLGLQFHPESVLSPHGGAILRWFLEEARLTRRAVVQNLS